MSDNENINDYDINDLLELFNLNQNFTETQLTTQFINFLSNHKNISNNQMLFLKDAYEKLKKNIDKISLTEMNSEQYENDELTKWETIPSTNNVSDTYINEYKDSNLNPVKRETLKKLINIDSIFRKNIDITKTNEFMYDFYDELKNVISYKIVSSEIPSSWYTFSNDLKNNVFYITVNNYSTGTRDATSNIIYNSTTSKIIIPEGNYTSTQLSNTLNNLFINYKNGLDFLLFNINQNTQHCNFRLKNGSDSNYPTSPKALIGNSSTNVYYSPNINYIINFDLEEDQTLRIQQNSLRENNDETDLSCSDLNIYNMNLRPLYYNCGYILGFHKNIYTANITNVYTDLVSSQTPILYHCFIESESQYDEFFHKYIFIKIDDFNKNTNTSIISQSTNNLNYDNIIAKIPCTQISNGIIFNNNSDHMNKERTFFGPVNIQKMKISIVDKYDRLIDFGQSNISLTLEFNIIYS